MSLVDRVQSGLLRKFPRKDIERILTCWTEFAAGRSVERYLDDKQEIRQEADCFVPGLEAICFHDLARHPWATALEPHTDTILQELRAYNALRER
jgi:hypothetical protein